SLTPTQLIALKSTCRVADQHRNMIWQDSNGIPLMQYLPGFISESLALALEAELNRFVVAAPPKLPFNKSRYDEFNKSGMRSVFSSNTPCGEIRLVIYNQQGHRQRPGPSADLAGACYRTEASLRFRTSTSLTALSERLSQALGAIDVEAWNLARGNVIAAK